MSDHNAETAAFDIFDPVTAETIREVAKRSQEFSFRPETVVAALDRYDALTWENKRLRDALAVAERTLRDQPMQGFRTEEARTRRARAIDVARAALAQSDGMVTP